MSAPKRKGLPYRVGLKIGTSGTRDGYIGWAAITTQDGGVDLPAEEQVTWATRFVDRHEDCDGIDLIMFDEKNFRKSRASREGMRFEDYRAMIQSRLVELKLAGVDARIVPFDKKTHARILI